MYIQTSDELKETAALSSLNTTLNHLIDGDITQQYVYVTIIIVKYELLMDIIDLC